MYREGEDKAEARRGNHGNKQADRKKSGHLVRSRANWTFRDTSSCCSPETGRRTKDARTSSRPNPPCSHTCRSYTGHDLWGKQGRTGRAGESNRAEDVHKEADRAGAKSGEKDFPSAQFFVLLNASSFDRLFIYFIFYQRKLEQCNISFF